jgi:hypothetical protein
VHDRCLYQIFVVLIILIGSPGQRADFSRRIESASAF